MSFIARLKTVALAASVALCVGGLSSAAMASTPAPAVAQAPTVKSTPVTPVVTVEEIDNCKDKAILEKPFTGTLAEREAQARNIVPNTKVRINGFDTAIALGSNPWAACETSIMATKVALAKAAAVAKAPVAKPAAVAKTVPVTKAAPTVVAKASPTKSSSIFLWGILIFIVTLAAVAWWVNRPSKPKKADSRQHIFGKTDGAPAPEVSKAGNTRMPSDASPKPIPEAPVPPTPLGDADLSAPAKPTGEEEPELPEFLERLKK